MALSFDGDQSGLHLPDKHGRSRCDFQAQRYALCARSMSLVSLQCFAKISSCNAVFTIGN
jgi:hypothetical protein